MGAIAYNQQLEILSDHVISKVGNLSIMELKSQRCKVDYFYFIQEFWDTIVNDPPHWNWHIPYICSQIERLVHRINKRLPREHDLVINLPPGTTKSLICTVFLVPWIWTNYPYFRIIKVSYSDYLSLEQADLIRDITRSQKYQDMFPGIRLKKDNTGKSNFKVTYKEVGEDGYEFWKLGGGVLSTSVTAKATGFHAHLKIIDDPLDPYKAHSESELRTCNTWLSQVLSNRVVDKRIVPELIIMQRVHKKDPSGIALEKAKKGKKVKHICLPGDILSKGNKKRVTPKELVPIYQKQGGFLDPVRLDQEALHEQLLNLGQFGYKSQIDQNPTSPGSGMFQIIKISLINPNEFNEIKIVRIIRYWDKAGTQDGGTYTVGVKMAQLKNGHFLIMDVVRGQWGTSRREMIIRETVRLDGPLVPQYIEQEPGSGGKDSAYITKDTLEKMGNKVFLDRPTGDKIYRADPFSVAVNLGYVSIFKGTWNEDFLQELEDFPNTDNKDQVDASSAAYTSLKSSKRAGSW
jgi:predicted phage terminase large subunit-like protein